MKVDVPPITKKEIEEVKEKWTQDISNEEESIWRMFREDKYEKIPTNREEAVINQEEIPKLESLKIDSKHIPSQEVINIAGSLKIDSEIIINKALDENGNIKNMSEIFISYFKNEVKNKLREKYNEGSLNDIGFDNWFWREREFINELIQKLLNKEFKKDIDKAIVIKSILDFSKDQIDGPDSITWTSFETIDSLIKEFESKDISILEKVLLKKAIYDLNDIYSLDSFNPEGDLKHIKKKIGLLKRPRYFNNKLFNHSKLKFTKKQKDLIVSDNNYLDRHEFLGEKWLKSIFTNKEEMMKDEQKEFLTDFVVSKLSLDTIGIHSLKGRLIGWQKIENLDKQGEDAIIKDFFEIKKECPMNSNEDLALFKISSSLYFRDFIQQSLNIDLSKLNIENQFYFLNFIQGKKENELDGFKEFIEKSKNEEEKNNKIKTFLSIEQGGKEMGDKIISLGELPEEVAKKVFAKYGEIIDNVSKITEFARTNFTKEIETNPELIKKIEETLYIKGKQLLSQTYDDINNKKEINYEDIGKQLDRINADTITTFAIFKQAVKNGEKLPIESIEGSIFSKKDATSILPSQREEMSELYDKNYKDHPDREFIEKVKKYFDTAFIPEVNQAKNYFYTFEKDNKTRAFVRFEKQNDDSLYASALNVDEASKNFGLGEAMMDEALSREAKENILHATCLINNPSNMRYFEKGFISDHFKMVDNTNQLDLVWDEKKNFNILSKQKNVEELISMYLKDNYEGSIEIKREETLENLHNSIPEGKALVRCFRDPVKNNGWYAVYEKVPNDYGINLEETR